MNVPVFPEGMAAIILIVEFLIFSFLGWVIDSGYRSFTERRLINAGYFKGPFCPIYGLGALILVFIFKNLAGLPVALLIAIASLSLILVEYFGGLFTEKVLKLKLWDYFSSKFHLGGRIDTLHSFYWFLLAVFFYFLAYPYVILAEKTLSLFIPEFSELPALLLFSLVFLWLIIRKSPAQFLIIKGKFVNLTVGQYSEVFSNLRRLYKTHSESARLRLKAAIARQLENTGAKLKRAYGNGGKE